MLVWLLVNLDSPINVDQLAVRAHMAPRTFARRFRSEVGTTPHDWVTNQRVLLARRLLEETDLGVESGRDEGGLRRRSHPASPLRAPRWRHPPGLPHHLPRPSRLSVHGRAVTPR